MTSLALIEPSGRVRRRRLWSIFKVPSLAAADGPADCFVCDVIGGSRRATHHVVYENDECIAFLAKWPPLWGTTLVCPKVHKEAVTADFSENQYLDLHRVVRRVGNALEKLVPCERLYVLSLGSAIGNRHVHWHLAPLPPGRPQLMQQCRSYEELLVGRLDIPDSDYERLAEALRSALSQDS
jgi:diadenosine tetraphosphate (Ap4A) HIT family hydrolase